MTSKSQHYVQQLAEEIQRMPEEYLPLLLQIVRSYRQSVILKTAEDIVKVGRKFYQKIRILLMNYGTVLIPSHNGN